MTTITAPQRQALWMLNSLMVERVTADQTNSAYSMLEQWVTAEGNTPVHPAHARGRGVPGGRRRDRGLLPRPR